jgi:hypothetical protein
MALITSPTEMIPDLNYEYHTITVDTLNQTSANTWTCFLSQPLKNVVQARLLAARINTVTPANGSEHCYISIDELNSVFNDRATNVYEGQASLGMLRKSFASIVTTDDTGIISFKDDYPIATQYVNPIRSIDRLTVSIRNQSGVLITPPNPAENNYLVLRFVCRKPNL